MPHCDNTSLLEQQRLHMPELQELVHERLRTLHYYLRTEATYVG